MSNEYGAILQSVAASSESNESLQDMADGIQKRYRDARVKPPKILYTDRDCCSLGEKSRFQRLFLSWSELKVILDIWHFMRRIASGCMSESHPLYGPFMSQLSNCIFEWDEGDYNLLYKAKKQGVLDPSEVAVKKAI